MQEQKEPEPLKKEERNPRECWGNGEKPSLKIIIIILIPMLRALRNPLIIYHCPTFPSCIWLFPRRTISGRPHVVFYLLIWHDPIGKMNFISKLRDPQSRVMCFRAAVEIVKWLCLICWSKILIIIFRLRLINTKFACIMLFMPLIFLHIFKGIFIFRIITFTPFYFI